MTQLKLIIVLGFATFFTAGIFVGSSGSVVSFVKNLATPPATRPTTPPPSRPDERFPNFRKVLDLSNSQNEQVEKIRHEAFTHNEELSHKFREFDRQRDESVTAMLTADQKTLYDQIQNDRREHIEALHNEMVKTMKDANASIRAILTLEQRKKFDEMEKQHGPRRGPPMGGPASSKPPKWGGPFRHNHNGPETTPARPETQPGEPRISTN